MGSKPTQLWPGQRMRAFFRSIFREEQGVSDALADRLAEVCERHINRMLVWDGEPAKAAPRVTPSEAIVTTAREEDEPSQASADDSYEDVSGTEAGAPWSVEHLEEQVDADVLPVQAAEVERFDPFEFSVVVVLARSGADALKARLKDINDPVHLRELADAQHLGVDPELRDNVRALRKAILHGAEQRLADRRAAAS